MPGVRHHLSKLRDHVKLEWLIERKFSGYNKIIMSYAIIFDFGGVLMKTLDYSYRHAWDDRLQLPRGSVERVVHGSVSWRHAQVNQLKLDDEALTALQTDYFKGDSLDAELIDLIKSLKAKGVRIGLLSNDALSLRAKLALLEIADLFDPLIISADIGVMKPAPEAFQAVLDQVSLPPERVLFIDDLPENISGANAVGIKGILYQPGMNLGEVLETYLRNG
jgi:HAD superfamily hydrolase (TIGR01509 family)